MTSNPNFNDETSGTETAAALAQYIKGKNVIVTGLSHESIGFTTALAIASQNPNILILASRTNSKLETVAYAIHQKHPSVPIKKVLLDLSSVDSIRNAVVEINSLVDHLDVLINNAGVSMMTREPLVTPDGTMVDKMFFINHVGPFLLTTLLFPKLRAAAVSSTTRATRVVNLSSHGHRLSPVRFSDYQFARSPYTDVPEAERSRDGIPPFFTQTVDGYPGFMGYGQSKSANILYAAELSRRLQRNGDNIAAFSVHPGTIETDLSRYLTDEGRETINKTAPHGKWKNQDQGSATSIVAAFDPKLGEIEFGENTVGYLSDCQLRDDLASPHAADPDMARRLWEESEKMLQISVGL